MMEAVEWWIKYCCVPLVSMATETALIKISYIFCHFLLQFRQKAERRGESNLNASCFCSIGG